MNFGLWVLPGKSCPQLFTGFRSQRDCFFNINPLGVDSRVRIDATVIGYGCLGNLTLANDNRDLISFLKEGKGGVSLSNRWRNGSTRVVGPFHLDRRHIQGVGTVIPHEVIVALDIVGSTEIRISREWRNGTAVKVVCRSRNRPRRIPVMFRKG